MNSVCIIAKDISCSIIDAKYHLDEIGLIREVCRARPAGYYFMPTFRAGVWDGYISLMTSYSTFPTGLLPIVTKALVAKDYTVDVIHKTCAKQVCQVNADDLDGITLRAYQVEAANTMLKAKRGVAKMATNSGKTEVMAAMIKALNVPTILLVHRKELLYQTAERLTARGVKNVGIVGDGEWHPDIVTVAMIQTLQNKLKKLDMSKNKLLFIDECHHLSSDQAMDVFNHIPGCYRYGLSGTPIKYDLLADMKLLAATGDIIYELENEYLIKHEYSAKPYIELKVIELDDDIIWKMDYTDAVDQLIVHNFNRNKAVFEYAVKATGTVLVIVDRIEHGKLLNKMIPGSVFVYGSDTTERRREILDRMRSTSGVYIASPIFDEGIDVPSVDTLVYAAGGRSNVKLLQRIGRGMRKKEGDNTLHILDFIDDTNKHLLEHSNDRLDSYIREGFITKVI